MFWSHITENTILKWRHLNIKFDRVRSKWKKLRHNSGFYLIALSPTDPCKLHGTYLLYFSFLTSFSFHFFLFFLRTHANPVEPTRFIFLLQLLFSFQFFLPCIELCKAHHLLISYNLLSFYFTRIFMRRFSWGFLPFAVKYTHIWHQK